LRGEHIIKKIIPYGRERIEFTHNIDITELDSIEPEGINIKQLESAIDNPIKGEPLERSISSSGTVLIIVSDMTRKTGAEIIVPKLIEKLKVLGIMEERISILFALGIHRKLTSEEQLRITGLAKDTKIGLFNHDPDNKEDLAYFGTVFDGSRIYLNRRIKEADHVILTGAITFHYFAGFSGGRKSLIPGCASRELILQNHKMVIDKTTDNFRNPNTDSGKLRNNPLHEFMLEVLDFVKPTFLINTIFNSKGEIINVFSGDPLEAHLQGCEYYKKHYKKRVSDKTDLLIVSCGGAPKDINLIQAHKSLENSIRLTDPGTPIIFFAECSEGVGWKNFEKWAPELSDTGKYVDKLVENYEVYAQTLLALSLKAKHNPIYMHTELDLDILSQIGFHKLNNNLEKGISELLDKAKNPMYVPCGSVFFCSD